MSIRGIDSTRCDWDMHGSDLRAVVQSVLMEKERLGLDVSKLG